MERVSIGPLGSCFRSFPPGDKTFSKFQKGLSLVNLKPPEPFPTPIKWKEYQVDPLGGAFAPSLRWIKRVSGAPESSAGGKNEEFPLGFQLSSLLIYWI